MLEKLKKLDVLEEAMKRTQEAVEELNHPRPLIPPDILKRMEESVYCLCDPEPIGVCFFVSATRAVTCHHNLRVDPTTGKVRRLIVCKRKLAGEVAEQFELCVIHDMAKLDFAVLETKDDHKVDVWLDVMNTSKERPVRTTGVWLVAYQISLSKDTDEFLEDGMPLAGFFNGHITKVSTNHILYECESFSGDSGGAVTFIDGKVVAMHQSGVNQAKDLRQRRDVDESVSLESNMESRVDDLEDSVSSMIASSCHGAVGLLAHVFIPYLL